MTRRNGGLRLPWDLLASDTPGFLPYTITFFPVCVAYNWHDCNVAFVVDNMILLIMI